MGYCLILGRATSGDGGQIILSEAEKVLEGEFPELYDKIKLSIPDEKSRRTGQSVAAASLPAIPKAKCGCGCGCGKG